MKKQTLGQKFNAMARELMPEQDSLQVPEDIDNADRLDEYAFRELGEYLGGMAAVILRIIKAEGGGHA